MTLYVEGRREGYAPNQCRKTMTCGELAEYFASQPEDMKVYLSNDREYTFGSITLTSFYESDKYDDEDDYDEEE